MVRRKLAKLELDVDRQQGWARGGTKGQVRAWRRVRVWRSLCCRGRAGLQGSTVWGAHSVGSGPCFTVKARSRETRPGNLALQFRVQSSGRDGALRSTRCYSTCGAVMTVQAAALCETRRPARAQAAQAQEQAARLRAQEAQLAAMRRQLEAMQARFENPGQTLVCPNNVTQGLCGFVLCMCSGTRKQCRRGCRAV